MRTLISDPLSTSLKEGPVVCLGLEVRQAYRWQRDLSAPRNTFTRQNSTWKCNVSGTFFEQK